MDGAAVVCPEQSQANRAGQTERDEPRCDDVAVAQVELQPGYAIAPPKLPNVAREDWRNRSCNWSVRASMATDPLSGCSGVVDKRSIVGSLGCSEKGAASYGRLVRTADLGWRWTGYWDLLVADTHAQHKHRAAFLCPGQPTDQGCMLWIAVKKLLWLRQLKISKIKPGSHRAAHQGEVAFGQFRTKPAARWHHGLELLARRQVGAEFPLLVRAILKNAMHAQCGASIKMPHLVRLDAV